ncbi:hypothetical protein Pmar_PMAR029298 [Perkinsus marinus ATCC 50983]|uniref:Uncharacterized protein n=1 Tax=Perkinsus marinus (strain ATCC 50983 / TXsc) TaxID=423536 RepID=C5KMS4_PERM5|nr:hypothetical protein Pmar_PMAR029298 [Perkinsus marinus ATCC 50983]EER14232.1 hypothetical protein Pmar_PMAR029298 [Perkinsus marinus ATCC 50983]|eukprot:XP_002782437.1 hypothetical protein Pmar_PMAR029298 [Perkinsus marinus ATCC 50983]
MMSTSIMRAHLGSMMSTHTAADSPLYKHIYLTANIDIDSAVVQYRRVRILSLIHTVTTHPNKLPEVINALARLLEGECGDALIECHEQLVLDAVMSLWVHHWGPYIKGQHTEGGTLRVVKSEKTSHQESNMIMLVKLVQLLCAFPHRYATTASVVAEICLKIDKEEHARQGPAAAAARKCYSALRSGFDIITAWRAKAGSSSSTKLDFMNREVEENGEDVMKTGCP